MAKCGCCPIALTKCYPSTTILTCPNPVVTSGATTSPVPTESLITANPNNIGFIGTVATTADGNASGGSYGGWNIGQNNIAAYNGIIEYRWATAINGAIEIRLWNNGGNDVNDLDGIDTAFVTLLDGFNSILWQGALNANNGGGPDITSLNGVIAPVNGIRVMRLQNFIALAGGAANMLWRNINFRLLYRATVTWTCNNRTIIGSIEGVNAGITLAGGNLTQTNGPHTITFNSTRPFTATIQTNRPGNFSTLNITNGTVVTITGNMVQTFLLSINNVLQPAFAVKCDDGTVEWRASDGTIINANQLVECT